MSKNSSKNSTQKTKELIFFAEYHTFPEIERWVVEVADRHPKLTTLITVATTYEKRDLRGLRIGSNASSDQPVFFFNCGIHAREWIAPATCVYIIHHLVEGYGKDSQITQLLDSMNFHVLPVLNADGYVYTWERDRLWRKSRTPNAGSTCIGTDPNRNFDDHWGTVGTSKSPCSDIYCGSAPFSEPVAKGLSNYVSTLDNLLVYIDFHSYSQMFLSPWGWTTTRPVDYTVQMAGMKAAVDALTAVHGTKYTYGPSSTTIYETSGGTDDWVYSALGVKLSYVVELRDTGRYGFLLPAAQIVPTGQETMAAVMALAKFALQQKQ